MATKSKTDTKSKKTENSTSSGSETSKTETSSTKTEAATDSGGKSSSGSTASRPISYFSSVSTDDYRSGWDGIFGKDASKPKPKTRKPVRKTVSKLPLTITLDGDDLDADVRAQLEEVFRKQIKKKRLNYDKLSGNGQVSLQVSCRISGG